MTFRRDSTMTTTVTNSQYDLGHTVSEVIDDDTLKVKEGWKWDEKRCVSFQSGSLDWIRTKRIVRQNVDKQIGGVYFLVEDPSERIDYAG